MGRCSSEGFWDGSVWAPERLDFAAAPILGEGLVRLDRPARVLNGDAPLFNLQSIAVDDATRDRAAYNAVEDRARLKPERASRRAEYVQTETPLLVMRTGVTHEQAAQMLEGVGDHELCGGWIAQLQDGREVSIEHMLTHVSEFDRVQMHDPLEPGYGNSDNRIAIALLSEGDPIIYSHAHGGRRFRLLRDPTKVGFGSGPIPAGMSAVPNPPPPLLTIPVLGKSPRFKLLSGDDLRSMPPMRWCIRDVLPAQGLASVYGPPGSGKSFLLLDMAAAIAEGRDWFGHRVTCAPVVYCVLEGTAGMRNRQAAREAENCRPIPAGMRLVMQPFRLPDEQDVLDLAAAASPHGTGAVVFDPHVECECPGHGRRTPRRTWVFCWTQ